MEIPRRGFPCVGRPGRLPGGRPALQGRLGVERQGVEQQGAEFLVLL